jgi:cyclase
MSILKVLFAAALIAHYMPASAEDDYAKEVVKVTPLNTNLYMLEGAGGNMTASIGADGVLLVDDDFGPMADKLLATLKELKGASPRFIVNTHFHYDHTGGNVAFGRTATIIAPTHLRERLMSKQTLWRTEHPALPSYALPILTFDQALTLHFNAEEIKVVHLPNGHTDGDAVVFFSHGKVVSMGDLYFSGMYPIFHPEHAGDLDKYERNVAWVLQHTPDGARIVPGHGPLTDKAGLVNYHQMIVASIRTVREGIRNGQTLQQIQQTGLAPEWEPFSHGYRNTDQWLASIHQSLIKNNP